jgi:dienelactone hydrolase
MLGALPIAADTSYGLGSGGDLQRWSYDSKPQRLCKMRTCRGHFVGEGDVDATREIVATVDDAELFLYPGDQHYLADSSLPSYHPAATVLLTRRVLDFLGRVQQARR